MFAGSQTTSGETAQCTADMTLTSLNPASATVVPTLHSTQVTAMLDQRIFDDVRLKERGAVHGPQSVARGLMIITSRPVVVDHRNETVIPARLVAIQEVASLQIGIPTATVKDLDRVTVSGRAADRAHGNTATPTVIAAMAHIHVKIATTAQYEIGSHPWQTVGDHGHQKLMIHSNRILRKNLSVLGSPDHRKSKMVVVISRTDMFLHCIV